MSRRAWAVATLLIAAAWGWGWFVGHWSMEDRLARAKLDLRVCESGAAAAQVFDHSVCEHRVADCHAANRTCFDAVRELAAQEDGCRSFLRLAPARIGR